MTELGGREPFDGPATDRYLERLETTLRMPPDAAWEVLDEVGAHIDDAIAAGLDEGLTKAQAERRALERLGPPDVLGRDLRRTHQTRRRLLAAAGGGAWQAARGAVRGYMAGTVIALTATLGAAVALAVVQLIARSQVASIPGTSLLAMTIPPIWGALWVAGRELTLAVSATSRRSVGSIRLPIALIGAGSVAALVALVPADYTWLTVPLSIVTPAVVFATVWTADTEIGPWLFGDRWATLQPRLRRGLFLMFVGSLVTMLVASLAFLVLDRSPATINMQAPDPQQMTDQERWHAAGYDVVAPTVIGFQGFGFEDFGSPKGFAIVTVPDDVVDWDAYRDLRFEVWPATSVFAPGRRAIRGDHPMAVVPVDDPWARTGYAIRVGYPDADGYLLFLTGEDPKTGQRLAFGAPSDGESLFHGSLLDWFQPR